MIALVFFNVCLHNQPFGTKYDLHLLPLKPKEHKCTSFIIFHNKLAAGF